MLICTRVLCAVFFARRLQLQCGLPSEQFSHSHSAQITDLHIPPGAEAAPFS